MKMPILLTLILFLAGCQSNEKSPIEIENDSLHIVFITGDEEYRSEESMPMLARILKNRYRFQVSVVYAITEGVIDPNRRDNIPGLEILDDADMMVMFTRFRKLPDHQLRHILDFAASGKPMAGFRTSTHAFQYGEGHENHHLDFDWPQEVFGLPWISHHGSSNSTDVLVYEGAENHPILRGINPFHARSWLYHATTLHERAEPLLTGRAVEGADPGGEHFGDPYAVAWTHNYLGETGTSRVFFTTLGHPQDFFDENMRRLSIQGIFWAMGFENQIPESGLDVEIIGEYRPNPAGFGEQFKQDLRPESVQIDVLEN